MILTINRGYIINVFFYVLIFMLFNSCASILRSNTPQRPNQCEPKRSISWGWLVAEIVLTGGIGVGIDFATGAIYNPPKPEAKLKRANKCNNNLKK